MYTRLLRADIVEQLQREDYIVTARAKGIAPWRILLRHALPNSLFGLITLVALNLGTLVGAVAIIEPIFSLPGVGAILIQSITNHDMPVVEGIVVVFAVVVVLANLLADVLYAVLDPRIRYERSDFLQLLGPRRRRPGPPQPARRRGRARNLRIWLPAGFLVLLAAACFLWPLVYPVPKPTGGSILDLGPAAAVARPHLRHRPGRQRHLLPAPARRAGLVRGRVQR